MSPCSYSRDSVVRSVCKNRASVIFSSSRLSNVFGHLFCMRLGSFGGAFASKIAETDLKIPIGAAKSRPRILMFGYRGLQEFSKMLPKPPSTLQEPSTNGPEPGQNPTRSTFPCPKTATAVADRIAEPSRRTRGRQPIAAWRPTITIQLSYE